MTPQSSRGIWRKPVWSNNSGDAVLIPLTAGLRAEKFGFDLSEAALARLPGAWMVTLQRTVAGANVPTAVSVCATPGPCGQREFP